MLPFFNQLQRFLVNFKNPSIVSNSNTAQKVMMTNGYTETYGGSATTGRGDMNFATRRLETIEQVFVFNGTKQQAFTNLLPAYARVIEAWLNYDTALAYTTATNMGVGGTTTLAGAVLTTGTLTAKNTVTQAKPLASAISGVADNTGAQGLVELAVRVMRWGLWMAPYINTFLRRSAIRPGTTRTAPCARWWRLAPTSACRTTASLISA